MDSKEHYLKRELYDLVKRDSSIFEFLQVGSLDGIWYWDIERPEVEWMSERFWTLLGYDATEKEHLASEWQDLIYPEDLRTALANFTEHCNNPSHPYDQVVRYLHKDGSTIWVRCRGIAIRDETGKPVRMLGAHTDLTQLKRREEELRRKQAELEEALSQIQTLSGLLPICSVCKKIGDEEGHWHPVEHFVGQHTEADFSHGYCPSCHDMARQVRAVTLPRDRGWGR